MEDVPQGKTSGSRSDATNIIITVPAFQTAADSLKNLHETLESITTEVVTTDWIDANYLDLSKNFVSLKIFRQHTYNVL